MTELEPDPYEPPLESRQDILGFLVAFCAGMFAGAFLAAMLCAVARFT